METQMKEPQEDQSFLAAVEALPANCTGERMPLPASPKWSEVLKKGKQQTRHVAATRGLRGANFVPGQRRASKAIVGLELQGTSR